jgi:hypothetical protein
VPDIDIKTKDTPGWWLKRLSDKLEINRKRIDPLYARYEGNAPMPPSVKAAPEQAQRFFKTARTNFEEMIVRAVRYRLRVTGVLTAAAADEIGDREAMQLWIDSGADAEQHNVHRNMLISGSGYMLAAEYEGEPAATSEDPRQVVTIHDPVRQSRIRAGAKFFHDFDEDVDFAYLYRPDPEDPTRGRRWVARRTRRTTTKGAPRFGASGWVWNAEQGGEDGESVPVPMPLVRYRNEEGVGEFERHVDHLDRIDHLILQGLVIATLQAFKQRAIYVAPEDMPDTDPETGERIDYTDVFLADPGALWKLPATAKMWESDAVDLSGITTMATKEIERLSAVTFTPMSMFTPEAANQSAAGASLVKEGLTSKVEDKHGPAGASHVQTLGILGRIAGLDSLQNTRSVRVRWAPAERYTLAEKADAGPKAKAAGMPWRTLMDEVWQMTPEDIARMESERLDDAALLPLLTPPPPALPAAPTRSAAPPAAPTPGA